MRLKVLRFLELLLISVVFWILAFSFLFILRYNGLEHEISNYVDESLDIPVVDFYEFAIIIGFSIGFIYCVSEYLFDTFLSKRLSIISVLLIKSIIYFVVIVGTLSWVSLLVEETIDIDLETGRGWWHTDPVFWNVVIYFVVASSIFSILKIAKEKFGSGVFLKMLLGTYRKPKEEERILMFLDLKDSTKIAELLGHNKYSSFIQDCFIDLNSLIRQYEADIYQYVGDEAVITWIPKRGFRNNNCANLYFAFQDKLEKRKNYYNNTYQFNPKFKASLHVGKLIVAEVGTIKKELAYHGDVINTAARIQSLCNTLNSSLLVSEELLNRSFIKLDYNTELKGDITLRGKSETLKIYAISR